MLIQPHPSPTSPRASSSTFETALRRPCASLRKRRRTSPPRARAALAQAAPTPAFAVVAPPKRFDAEANDARCVPRRPTPSHRQTRRASSPRARPEPRGAIPRVTRGASTRRRALDERPRARLRLSDDGSHAAFPRKTRSPRDASPTPTDPPDPSSPSRPPGSPPTPSSRSPPRPQRTCSAQGGALHVVSDPLTTLQVVERDSSSSRASPSVSPPTRSSRATTPPTRATPATASTPSAPPSVTSTKPTAPSRWSCTTPPPVASWRRGPPTPPPRVRVHRRRRPRRVRGPHRRTTHARRRHGPHPLPSGRFVFGHRYVKPIEFTKFWGTASANRSAAPARKARRSVRRRPARPRVASPPSSRKPTSRRRPRTETKRRRKPRPDGGARVRRRMTRSSGRHPRRFCDGDAPRGRVRPPRAPRRPREGGGGGGESRRRRRRR